MYWYYNSTTGAVIELPEFIPFVATHLGIGWHGPFNSHDEAISFYNTNKGANPGWKPPSSAGDVIAGIPGDVGTQVSNTSTAVSRDILGGVDLSAWFIRVGEILLGLVLVGVGVAKLTGTGNFIMEAIKKVPV